MNYKIELIELDALEIPSTVDKDLDISPGIGVLIMQGGGHVSTAAVLIVSAQFLENRQEGRFVTVFRGHIGNPDLSERFTHYPGPMEALIASMEKTLLKKILGRRYKKESSNVCFF